MIIDVTWHAAPAQLVSPRRAQLYTDAIGPQHPGPDNEDTGLAILDAGLIIADEARA